MYVEPNALVRIVVKCNMKGHNNRVCDDSYVEARLMDAYLITVAFTHGKISGMDSGVRVRYSATLADLSEAENVAV